MFIMFAGDSEDVPLPGHLTEEDERPQNSMHRSANSTTLHPNDYIGKFSKDDENPIFKKMQEEEDVMRTRINARKLEAERLDNEIKLVREALKKHGYSEPQINEIFNNGMLTREIIEELLN